MTDTINVPRELLSRVCHTDNHTRQTARRELRNILLQAPSQPAEQPDLADRLEAFIPRGDGYNSDYANTLTEAVEALRSAQDAATPTPPPAAPLSALLPL